MAKHLEQENSKILKIGGRSTFRIGPQRMEGGVGVTSDRRQRNTRQKGEGKIPWIGDSKGLDCQELEQLGHRE